MSSTLADYDALPSESSSASQTLCQQEDQLSCGKVEAYTMPPASKLTNRACIPGFSTSWGWESAASFLVLTAPIIMFATVYPHAGQPLPQWPFKISINSLLSVYGVVFKAAMGFILTSCIGQLQWMWFSETRPLTDMLQFDNATRGAAGALDLLWRQRLRQPLAAIGCAIMILAVAVDPFVQQLVRPVDCSAQVSDGKSAATLPRTNIFEGYGYSTNLNSACSTQGPAMDDKYLENALYDAIFSPRQDPPWRCSTGNCTFQDAYGTIGICSSCQDSSGDVIISSTCSHPNSSYASHHPRNKADCPANSSFIVESNSTASGYIRLGTKMTVFPDGDDSQEEVYPVVADAHPGIGLEVGFRQFGRVRDLSFGFLLGATATYNGRTDWTATGNSTCDSDESVGTWSCQGYGAATCSLQPCVQIYKASISNGVLEEYLVASSSDTAWGTLSNEYGSPLYLSMVDTQCSAGIQTPINGNSSAKSRWLPYDFTVTGTDAEWYKNISRAQLPDDVTSLLDSSCLYLISASGVLMTTGLYLDGSIQAPGQNYFTRPSDPDFLLAGFEGPPLLSSIYNWGHTDLERVQSNIANISDALTTYIRSHGGTQHLPVSTNLSRNVQGKVYHYATCLQVHWLWLSFPASLAVLTILFFLTVVEATTRKETAVWKASPLVWILRADGLRNDIYDSATGSCEAMKERSNQIVVHLLDKDSDGPRIRMADLKDPNLRWTHDVSPRHQRN